MTKRVQDIIADHRGEKAPAKKGWFGFGGSGGDRSDLERAYERAQVETGKLVERRDEVDAEIRALEKEREELNDGIAEGNREVDDLLQQLQNA